MFKINTSFECSNSKLTNNRYRVTVTVRSDEKGHSLLDCYPDNLKTKLSYTVVEDIVRAGAYDEV
jgi:hypothetical protein